MIDIVTVNWNAGPQLKDCIESVLAHSHGKVSRIIVVDNGSTDGSADVLESLPGVDVIRAGENLGFAAACNKGAEVCGSPYLLFLNPDTRVEANSFTEPLAFMEDPRNAKVGICGIQLVDEDGVVSPTCSRFPTLARLTSSALGLEKLPGFKASGMKMVEWGHRKSSKVDQVMGAFFLIRREVFDACDGFDDRFFVYFEEVDLAFRAAQSGWGCWYLAEARAFHAGGGTSRQVKAKRLFYSLRSRLLYGFKHFVGWRSWFLVGVTGLMEPVTRTVWCSFRGDWEGVAQTWSAYKMLWRNMGRIINGEGRSNP